MAAAHGRISWGLRSPVMWKKAFGFLTAQTPDRSGLPSASRGAAAVKFTLPSRVRGTPGVGRFGHCANRETLIPHKIAATLYIGAPYCPADCHRFAFYRIGPAQGGLRPRRGRSIPVFAAPARVCLRILRGAEANIRA